MKVTPAVRTATAAAALFAINAWLTLPLFFIPYTTWMGSIEAAYIGLARYIPRHLAHLDWFPLWYGGIPYPDTYPPLLHFAVALAAAVGRISPALSYHAVTATVYALGPVALFWAAWRLGAPLWNAWFAALGYSLISPSCWLVRVVRADAGGWFGPRRLDCLVPYGEGPHLTSLLLLPLAVAMVHLALEKRRPVDYAAAVLTVASVALSNWIGAFALALALGAYLLSGFGGFAPRVFGLRLFRAAAIGAAAYAVACPWMTPSIINTVRVNAPFVGGRFLPNPKLEAAFAAGLLLLAWGLSRLALGPLLRFALLLLYSTAFITLGAYDFHLSLLPQPERYHLEMDMAFWLTAAGLPLALRSPAIRRTLAAFLLLAALPILLREHRKALDLEKPIDIESTAEYRISRWLGANFPGHRVFAPGTIGFWMNAFSDTPMLTGGFDNGMRNTFLQEVNYQIYAGDKQETALDWLRAFGCDAVVGGAKQSREVYHPYAHPEKFAGLPELWRDGPEVIYAVPRHSSSLAHAIHAADLPPIRPPAYDTTLIKPYLAALDDPALPPVSFAWRGQSAATLAGDLRPGQLISVQIAYDQGWTARVDGQARPIRGDTLGQIVVEPHCSGPCTVQLLWDGGLEAWIARWVSRAVLAGGLLWIILWRKRSASPTMN